MSRSTWVDSDRLRLGVVAASLVAGCCPRVVQRPVDRRWFVVVGDVEAKQPDAAQVVPVLRTSIEEALKADLAVITTWPSGESPSQADLDAVGRIGVRIDATITDLSITTTSYPEGDFMKLVCSIELVLTSFPSGEAFLTLPSSATVTGPATPDTRPMEEDCVRVVGDGLVREELGEAIHARAGR